MSATPLAWLGFTLVVLALLALHLGLFHRRARAVPAKEAGGWVAIWVALALAFGAGLSALRGRGPALEYVTGYLIEYSLSLDNIFVFALIFSSFAVPAAYQRRVLSWGSLGALVMRAALIRAGAALIKQFHGVTSRFGAVLAVAQFHDLHVALAAVLTCVGATMVLADVYPIPILASLLVIVTPLDLGVAASLGRNRRLARRALAQGVD